MNFRFLSLVIFVSFWNCSSNKEDKADSAFELHPEFEMQLVALEPLVKDPVDLEFDADGHAYVLQMPGYPHGIDQSSIVRLVDENSDGIYDDKLLFAENLNQASAFLPFKNGFLVAAPPHLLHLEDTDGDGVADKKDILMSGFTDANLQHNYNGLTYGIDNWIYLANGGNGGYTFWSENPSDTLRIGRNDFRIKIDGKKFESVGRSSGGYELALDNWGRFFGTHNVHHINAVVFPHKYMDGMHLEPANTLHNISDHEENGLARIFPIGIQETRVNHPEQSGYFSGACGITYYGGGAFSSDFESNIFVNDVVLNLVHRDKISNSGTTFRATRVDEGFDFLASADRNFRPVNSTVGPDGALYIVDMYRKVIEHPEWIPDQLEQKMDLDAGKDKGRIYKIKQKGRALFNWTLPRDPANLIEILGHQNQWQRLTAQRLILEQQTASTASLLRDGYSAESSNIGKAHILWCLEALDEDISDIIMDEMNPDIESGFAENIIRISEKYLKVSPVLVERLLSMTLHVDRRVKMQAILSLGTIPWEMLNSLKDDILFSLKKNISGHDFEDPYFRMALMTLFKNHPTDLLSVLPQDTGTVSESVIHLIAMRVAQVNDVDQIIEFLAEFRDQNDMQHALDGLNSIGISAEGRNAKSRLNRFLNQVKTGDNYSLLASIWSLKTKLELPLGPTSDRIIDEVTTRIQSNTVENEEIPALVQVLRYGEIEEVKAPLFDLLDTRHPITVQQSAMEVLGDFDDPQIGDELVRRWSSLSPSIRRRATDFLIYRDFNHDLLFKSLASGTLKLAEFNFDLERRRRLLWSDNEETRRRAEALFSDVGVVQRKDAIEKMRSALVLTGVASEGKKIYAEQCGTCHRFGSLGNSVGPDLTEISRKSKETLLHDILDPNAAADPEYINHVVDLEGGSVLSGIIEEETDVSLTLVMMGGGREVISKSKIRKMQSTGLSLMPEGLENSISPQQMADLLVFLQRPQL